MRILYVHNMNQMAGTFGEDLTRRGHSVQVYEPRLASGFAPLPLNLALMPGRILEMRHSADKLNPSHFDLAHICWASYGVLGLVSRIPFIVHCRGTDVRERLQQPFFHLMFKPIFHRAAAVLCTTPDLLPILRPVCPDAQFFPLPVDTEQFAPGKREQSRPWTVLLFARLDLNKGCDVAMEGIARFAQRHPEVYVKLLDWGSETKKYKQLYSGCFEFVPPVALESVHHLIWSADVIVGQFFLGALGLSELQAMSCGKPVIASFRYEEAYPTPPPLCQARNAQEVDDQLEHLFQRPEAATELGLQARKWIMSYHSRQILAAKLETLYQSILRGQRRGVALFDEPPAGLKIKM